jgi:hypothetical protein
MGVTAVVGVVCWQVGVGVAGESAAGVGAAVDASVHHLVDAHAITRKRATARVITSAAVTPRRSFVYRPGRERANI